MTLPIKATPDLGLDEVMALRLWNHVHRTRTCWIWTGPTDGGRYPYPRCHIAGSGYLMAHRAIYELLVGPIPEGLTLDHLCRNTMCVNPKHLEPVTLAENILRGNGLAARNARKTACENGHPFVKGSFFYSGPNRKRVCRACHNTANRRNRAKARERAMGAEVAA